MSEHDKGFSRFLNTTMALPSGCHKSRAPSASGNSRLRSLTVFACILALFLSTTTPALATGGGDPTNVVVDVLVARPISLVATVAGAVLFVVSLPVAAVSKSVRTTTETLVAAPAKDLFTRPVGDLEDWLSY